MSKNTLTILLVNRALKVGETAVKDIFQKYEWKYDLIMFPPKDDDPGCRIQIVSYQWNLIRNLEELLNIRIAYDEDRDFYDFDLTEIQEEVFYEMLSQQYEVKPIDLTSIESS